MVGSRVIIMNSWVLSCSLRIYNYMVFINQFLRILPIIHVSQITSQFIVNIGIFAAFLYLKCNILLQIKKWRNRVYKDHIIMCNECPSISNSSSRAFLLPLPLPQSILYCGYCKQYHNPTIRPSAQVSAQLYMCNGFGHKQHDC